MSPPSSPRLVDSFTVPKDVLKEFEEMGDLIERWRETLERAEGRCEEEEWDIVEEE